MTRQKSALFLFLLFLFAPTSGFASSPATDPSAVESFVPNALLEAEALYRTRDQAGHAERAIALYDKVLKIDPHQAEVLWKLARSYLWQGDRAEACDDKVLAYESAAQYAQSSIAAQPDSVSGHLMLGIAYGRIGELKGAIKSFFLVSKIKAEIQAVLDKDPGNDVAHHVLGILYRELPIFLGGSTETSIAWLKQAIRENPLRTRHYLELAKSYLKQDKEQEAIAALEHLLSISNPEDPVQTDYDRISAKSLLAQSQHRMKTGKTETCLRPP